MHLSFPIKYIILHCKMFYTFCYFPETSLLTPPLVNFSILFVCGGVGSWVCVCGGTVCGGGCVCLAYISEYLHMTSWQHTDTPRTLHLPRTYMRPHKILAKNAENIMFYHLRGWGVSSLTTSMDFIYYYIYMRTHKFLEVWVFHGGVWRGVVCVCVF